jgi:5-methylcytosine-specific restriction protein A
MFDYHGDMLLGDLATASGALHSAVETVRARGGAATADELREALHACHSLIQTAAQFQVETIAALDRNGIFTDCGYRRPDSAVANLLTLDRRQARELTAAAARVCARVDLQGQALPPALPATAAAFAAGTASLTHLSVIGQLLDSPAARRLAPQVWAGVEDQLAAHTGHYTPGELRTWGAQLIEAYDQDGPEPDDDEPPAGTNELRLTPLPAGGGLLKGRFDDPARYALIATVLDATSAPLTAEDQRSPAERQADALAEVCGFVADHAATDVLPSAGGRRPHVTVTVALADLENRARAACLDLGGTPSPAALRALCCDAAVVPVVLDGAGQPLDVGQSRRTIPDGLRRAVTARDRGCAHPGCDRPPSWCQIHHIHEWARGGATKLTNLVMLCRTHHREIHATGWEVRIGADGLPEFLPPRWLDPQQRPRRHARHHCPPARANPTVGPPDRRPARPSAGPVTRNRTAASRQ